MFSAEDLLSFRLLSLDSSHARLPTLSLPTPPPPRLELATPVDGRGVLFKTFNSPLVNRESASNGFWTTQSRVLRLLNFRSLSVSVVACVLHQEGATPSPISIWAPKEEDGRYLYCVYRTHEEACDMLSLSPLPLFSLSPALESDLEPFHKLRRVDSLSAAVSAAGDSPHYMSASVTSLPPPSPCKLDGVNTIRQSTSFSDFREPIRLGSTAPSTGARIAFPISSNPPNAKSNFRLGDWICKSPICGTHNFGRNVACIGCGSPRPTNFPGYLGQTQTGSANHPPRFPSPRFASVVVSSYSTQSDSPVPQQRRPPPIQVSEPPKTVSPYPILTPSGKQLSMGGKVQNISMNPLSPCFMFWSFNEPLPHPGQIRPSISVSLQHPPILNTGNRGPIEHQPGDWICQKCNYLNWRRRKVCQTCYPYAEGNGDSISTAVQAERIALLATVLSSDSPTISVMSGRDSRSLPPSPTSPSFSFNATSSLAVGPMHARNSALSRSRSHTDLFQNHHGVEKPIYQTSGGLAAPGPLLPAFLQDMVHSPTLSPASSASADFSLEDYDDVEFSYSPRHSHPLSRKPSTSLTAYSIWKLDGEEAKALSGHPQEDL